MLELLEEMCYLCVSVSVEPILSSHLMVGEVEDALMLRDVYFILIP